MSHKDLQGIYKNFLDKTQILLLQDVLKYLKTLEGSEKWGVKLIEIEEDAQKKGLEIFKISGNTACTCFSDSIVVSILSDDTNINETTSTLIANLSLIGATLLKAGVLWRGGMTIGNLIHSNDGIIIGQALIDAYELQLHSAKISKDSSIKCSIKETELSVNHKKE